MQRGDASQKIGLSLSRAGIRKIDLAQPRRLGADAASGSERGLWIGAASRGERENEDDRREQRGFKSESGSAHTIPPWRIALSDFRPAVKGDARMIGEGKGNQKEKSKIGGAQSREPFSIFQITF